MVVVYTNDIELSISWQAIVEILTKQIIYD